MQVRPRFLKHKILERIPLLTDDINNKMFLTKVEALLPSYDDEIVETPYIFWTVCCDKQETYGNKSVAYETCCYWKDKSRKNLFKKQINGFLIEEIEAGAHRMFGKNMFDCSPEACGIKTRFKLSKIE